MKSQAFSVRQVKNLFENTHADNSSFAIFSFAMNSQIKGKRMAEVKMLRHIVLSPSRTTWSEIYCKKRWSFYTCRLHGSNVGQGGNVKPAGECHCLVKKVFLKNPQVFFKAKLLIVFVWQKKLQFLFFSYVVNLS